MIKNVPPAVGIEAHTGLKPACWGDQFDVRIALNDPAYRQSLGLLALDGAFDAASKRTDVES